MLGTYHVHTHYNNVNDEYIRILQTYYETPCVYVEVEWITYFLFGLHTIEPVMIS